VATCLRVSLGTVNGSVTPYRVGTASGLSALVEGGAIQQ